MTIIIMIIFITIIIIIIIIIIQYYYLCHNYIKLHYITLHPHHILHY